MGERCDVVDAIAHPMILATAGKNAVEARALGNLATVLQKLKDYVTAIVLYKQCITLMKLQQNHDRNTVRFMRCTQFVHGLLHVSGRKARSCISWSPRSSTWGIGIRPKTSWSSTFASLGSHRTERFSWSD
jgi:hypothetical protein